MLCKKKSLPLKNFMASANGKCQMYSFFYKDVKRVRGQRAYLSYGQVDSMVLRLKQHENFENDLNELKHVLDLILFLV